MDKLTVISSIYPFFLWWLFTDHIDLSVQQFDVPHHTLYSDGFAELLLAVKVDIGGKYLLDPDPDKVQQDYDVQIYLSEDRDISPALDLQVQW